MRYIGSKARVVDTILELAGPPSGSGMFVDAFCGTGAVAAAAADAGWDVRLNDNLESAVTMAAARILSHADVPFRTLGGYETAVAKLQEAPHIEGFVWREYSPASIAHSSAGVERRYFTERNASKIDGVRRTIADWVAAGDISMLEEKLLLADLMAGVNKAANIAGTYGCFLRSWQSGATKPMQLVPRRLRSEQVRLDVQMADVFDVVVEPGDLVYFDPPYTKRQYAAYYHILETITKGDTPLVAGVTGLRPWKHLASPFCYKVRALNALVDLISRCDAHRVLLSYSDEGHVHLPDLIERLSPTAEIELHQLGTIGRYRPNQTASDNNDEVREYVIEVRKDTLAVEEVA